MYCIILINLQYHRKRKRFRPTIPVIIHHDDGKIEVEKVDIVEADHGQMDVNVQEQLLPDPNSDEILDINTDDSNDGGANGDSDSTSAYYQKAEKKQKAWEDLRSEAIKRTFQFAGRSRSSRCIHCGMEGSFRCKDCGYGATYCEECMLKMHTTINVYHQVEQLQVHYEYNAFLATTRE